jgi:cell division protein FtsQ
MKRFRDAMIWLTLIGGIFALLFFSVYRKSTAEVKTLVIHIEDIEGKGHLISEKEVTQILNLAAGMTISKSNIKSLNIRKLEERLKKDKRIERADLYFDSKNRLNVKIVQKSPVVRVSDVYGNEYYLDHNGGRVPVTKGSAVRVALLTGVTDTFGTNILASEKPRKLRDAFKVMQYVSGDPFLSALIEQAHIDQDSTGDLILIPKIGREKLVFGDARDMEMKFDNLKIFYRDGMPKLGWSRYKKLNLKITNQIAGTLANPELALKIKPVLRDTLQASLISKDNNKQSIHH